MPPNHIWGSFKSAFGLIGWDEDTFERKPRPSLNWLGAVSRTGAAFHPLR